MYRKLIAYLLAVLLSVTFTTYSYANITFLAKYGFWSVFGGSGEGNIPVCGIMNAGLDRLFAFKKFQNQNHFMIVLQKQTWKIPFDTIVYFVMKFDADLRPWHFYGEGSGDTVLLDLTGIEMRDLFHDLNFSSQAVINFQTGTEAGWQLSLTGSTQALDLMNRCMETWVPSTPPPTQPFDPPTTQPFGPSPDKESAPSTNFSASAHHT